MSAQPTYLLDGPLMLTPERRAAMTLQMAAILLADDAHVDRGDAIRCLRGREYNAIDVMMLVDDARAVAVQDLVAKEMSDQ